MIPFLGRLVINVVLTRRRKQVSNNFFYPFPGKYSTNGMERMYILNT